MVESFFCQADDPFSTVEWNKRNVEISDADGKIIYKNVVEAPESWSDRAVKIVASKYFYGKEGEPVKETSIRQLIHRVARTIADWGREDGYFKTNEEADVFYREVAWLCLHQYGFFNSPVWFNVGLSHVHGIKDKRRSCFWHWNNKANRIAQTRDMYEQPQTSACFVLSIQDNMESIMDVATTEAMIFKFGSGSGVNNSSLRSAREFLSGGGKPSGPLSFMRIRDQIALVVESGGKTRRASKIEILNIDHPDILEFIEAKPNEEKKAQLLIQLGYSGGMDGEAYKSIMFQNSNFSVRVTDDFMRAYEADEEIETKAITTNDVMDKYGAKMLLRKMVEGCHTCGDPGIQFDTTVNKWHTCPKSGRINGSNPCSEFMSIDDTACNLASLNIIKFVELDSFEIERFERAIDIFVRAQDILIDRSSFPSKKVAINSHALRPLGLGYTNLGASIMRFGFPYDSDNARNFAASVTSLLTARAYYASSKIAGELGSFDAYGANKRPMKKVLRLHKSQNDDMVAKVGRFKYIAEEAEKIWKSVISAKGFRNSQVTLLAPTGTISFAMDCDTTSVEPDYALVKTKKLSGGGEFTIINESVEPALVSLEYDGEQISEIIDYLRKNRTVVGAPFLKEKHLPVFDCATGERPISCSGHLKMMATVQPFLSGAISKTINTPHETTVDEIEQIYVSAWKMGLKSISVFREGSKESPLGGFVQKRMVPKRYKLNETCTSERHRFDIAGHSGYIHVGLFEDGSPGEIFIRMHKQGSTVCGLMDAFGIAVSIMLQYGVPLGELVNKFSYMKFDPSGWTQNKDIKVAQSPIDYIFRWMANKYLDQSEESNGIDKDAEENLSLKQVADKRREELKNILNAQVCRNCGNYPLRRTGNCYTCDQCGASGGCSG
jgi:ribonucleoside-diphosphate reductase alpha chain